MINEFQPQQVPDGIIEKEANRIALYNAYKHFVNTYDIDGLIITSARLMKWCEDPKRELICIFCGRTYPVCDYVYCHACKEYKGIMPNCPL
jgi:hypothetical protein